ncbi:MAG TPA: hypothetical protein VKI18_10225 [Albitalea sp.]|nr:hypothetical protein [Albitalea sp.]
MFRCLWIASRGLAALALAACAGAASAGTFGAHVGSLHFPQAGFNNFNPGAYYRSDSGWTAGAYVNSLRRGTVYGGYTWEAGRFGLTGGAITGYGHGVLPLLVPSAALFTHHGVTARVAYIPRVEKRIGSHVLHLMLEY